jgi:hypothetical protein
MRPLFRQILPTLRRELGLPLVVAAVMSAGAGTAHADTDGPDPAFLATTEPIYYEHHATYFWHHQWRWHDTSGWHAYDNEPALLADRRRSAPPVRWSYASAGAHGSGGHAHRR